MSYPEDTGGSDGFVAKVESAKPAKEDVVIFLATTTPEKFRDYQLGANARNQPVYFVDIRKLITAFHSVDEDRGDIQGNALKKLDSIDEYIAHFREHPEEIEEYCARSGLNYNPDRVYFATDDTGFHVDPDVWAAVNKDGIPAKQLALIDRQEGISGPGVETGPVLSAAMGAQNLMERIIQAAKTVRGSLDEGVNVYESSSLTMKGLTDQGTKDAQKKGENKPQAEFSVEVVHHLCEPDPNTPNVIEGKISTHHFKRDTTGGAPLSMLGKKEYLSVHNPRARIADQIGSRLELGRISKPTKRAKKPDPHDDFAVGVLPWSDEITFRTGLVRALQDEALHIAHDQSASGESTYDVLSHVEKMLKVSDGVLLLPDTHGNIVPDVPKVELSQQQRDRNEFIKLYTLNSLAVAKQLIARDADKPIVLMNHDGSWDHALAVHNQLANANLTKEFYFNYPVLPAKTLPDGIQVQSNGYFHTVSGDDYDKVREVSLRILTKERDKYQRHVGGRPLSDPDSGGIDPDDFNGFKVAMFCSASCENHHVNQEIKALSQSLSAKEFGIVYGAGDRYSMGAVLDGVLAHRRTLMAGPDGMDEAEARKKAYIAGVSTAPIIVQETEEGKFNDGLSYYQQTGDIYSRMARMLENSDAVVVAPGGAGSVQEWAAILMLKRIRPESFKEMPMVVYNPPINEPEQERIWNETLVYVLGEDYRDCIEHPDDMNAQRSNEFEARLKELDISIEDTKEGVEDRLEALREGNPLKHNANFSHRTQIAQRAVGDDDRSRS